MSRSGGGGGGGGSLSPGGSMSTGGRGGLSGGSGGGGFSSPGGGSMSADDGRDSVVTPIRTRNKDDIVRGANIITGPNGQATAAEDYKEHCRHELTFKIGDKVHVIHYTEDPKWAMARNSSGRRGLIPVSHFERAPTSAQDSMQVYFGTMTKQKAEELIRTEPYTDGKFLIRENGIYEGEVTLSLGFSDRQSGARKFAHYRVAKDETGMVYVCEDKRFTSVRQLIDFYMNQQSGLAHKLGLWYKTSNTRGAKGGLHAAIERSEFSTEEEIGKGHFGVVYRGKYKDKAAAIKILYNRSAENAVEKEGGKLAGVDHSCVVKYHGYMQDETIWVIMEFCGRGSLKQILKSHHVAPDQLSTWLTQAATGMAQLEKESIIHRNLRCRSLLISSDDQCKLSDYGWGTREDIQRSIRHPVKWTAPEVFAQQIYTSKSDAWSFGVVIWEVFSYGNDPYEKMSPSDIFIRVFQDGERLSPPADCRSPWTQIMPECFHLSPEKRPTFASIRDQSGGGRVARASRGGYTDSSALGVSKDVSE
ncbi:tyrosine-protein kinase CSK-like isoform X2 [Convolutriloba macropyga]